MFRKLLLTCAVALSMHLPLEANAQNYPNKPIRLIAPFPPGGLADFFGRLIAEGMSPLVGQPWVLENRPGAGGNLGTDLVAKSAPDGYTLALVAAGNIVINPFLYKSMPFDPMTDLTPVFNVGDAPQLLVIPASMPISTLKEYIALGRSKPGTLNYASAGVGTTTHLAMDNFARLAGIDMRHVPYKGVGQAIADLIAERVQALSVGYGPLRSNIQSGALRALVAASPRRLTAAPDVPTSAEAGLPGYEMTTWFGIFAPKSTPASIVNFLNANMQKILGDPKVRARLIDSGIEPGGGSAESFAALIRTDYGKWQAVVKASGARLDE